MRTAQLAGLKQQRAEAWREATHDLRGNLAIVQNVTSVLQIKAPCVPAVEKSLRMLERSVASLHALLNDLTTQARLDAGHERRDIHRSTPPRRLTICARLAGDGRPSTVST